VLWTDRDKFHIKEYVYKSLNHDHNLILNPIKFKENPRAVEWLNDIFHKEKCVIITTINVPTETILKHIKNDEYDVIIVGDNKTPSEQYANLNCIYLDVPSQKKLFPEFMSFQLPEVVMNRQSINSKELLRLHEAGNRLEVRSIFLQGLLLLDINSLPAFFLPVRNLFSEFWHSLSVNEISVLEACVTYSKSIPWASGIVVGAEDNGQLLEIVGFFRS
jgi:hypothetical protein